MIKRLARSVILGISWKLTRQYIQRHKPITIGVVGSIGKTGTKRAIAHVLSGSKRVAWQDGNYNDIVSVPLIFFGLEMPSLYNPFAWFKTHLVMLRKMNQTAPDVVVIELGTVGPGQIAVFSKYLSLDIAVVTAISHEHMQNFESLNDVAREELAVLDFAQKVYIAEQVENFIPNRPDDMVVYGADSSSDSWFAVEGSRLKIHSSKGVVSCKPQLKGEHLYNALVVAAEIGLEHGMTTQDVVAAIESLSSMPGRMNILAGKDGSVLIDDTYNSSPDAVTKALDYLYGMPQKRKIAVLGNMNEMGKHSHELHAMVARHCDPAKLIEVITIGKDANAVLAPSARERGCKVTQFDSPYAIGKYLADKDLRTTVILFKGSQNGVFLEEAVKSVLNNSADAKKLVRQSGYWQKRKKSQFTDAE